MPLEPLAFLKIQYVLYFYIVSYDNIPFQKLTSLRFEIQCGVKIFLMAFCHRLMEQFVSELVVYWSVYCRHFTKHLKDAFSHHCFLSF